MCIAGLSIIYPVNQIGLGMLFKPIEYMLWRKLNTGAANPMICGNFLAIDKE